MKWISILLFPVFMYGQDTNKVAYSTELAYGSIILHSQDIYPIGPSNPIIAGFDYSHWLLKKKHWNNCLCYPEFGLSLNFHYMDKPGILGWGMPVYAFLQPHFPLNKKWFLMIRAGLGYSWFSDPYDENTNPKNQSYSLYFNPFITLGSGVSYKINENFLTSFQLKYNHISNGGMREPNKGLNYPSFSLGLSYVPAGLNLPSFRKSGKPEPYKQELALSAFIAGKAIDATHVTYAVPGISLQYSRQLNRISAITGGMEWIVSYAYREKIKQENLDLSYHQLGILAGHEFLLGNFTFGQAIGVYVFREYKTKPSWYQRYTLNWNPFGGFTVGTSIKAHGHVAEFLDFRLGYKINLFKT